MRSLAPFFALLLASCPSSGDDTGGVGETSTTETCGADPIVAICDHVTDDSSTVELSATCESLCADGRGWEQVLLDDCNASHSNGYCDDCRLAQGLELDCQCQDGEDNDHDGLVDCDDDDCAGSCTEVCDDGLDNDGDALLDCEDADCASSCTEVCDDAVDNDQDGLEDCADDDCLGIEGCKRFELQVTGGVLTGTRRLQSSENYSNAFAGLVQGMAWVESGSSTRSCSWTVDAVSGTVTGRWDVVSGWYLYPGVVQRSGFASSGGCVSLSNAMIPAEVRPNPGGYGVLEGGFSLRVTDATPYLRDWYVGSPERLTYRSAGTSSWRLELASGDIVLWVP